MGDDPSVPLSIEFCFAREDESLVRHARSHLRNLERQGLLCPAGEVTAGGERLRERREALAAADIVLFFLSPDFFTSPDCQHEVRQVLACPPYPESKTHIMLLLLRPVDWDDQRLRGFPVVPRNRRPVTLWRNRDMAMLDLVAQIRHVLPVQHRERPGGEATQVCEDLQVEQSGRPAATPAQAARTDYYAYIPLPPNYIERKALLTAAREALLASEAGVALFSAHQAPRPSAFHGMGGIGKTVIARALCDDPAVQHAFPDGILWATLGQQPDLITLLREWIALLGGEVRGSLLTVNLLKNILTSLLRERTCLLVLDNVWHLEDLEVLCVGGPRCRVLFTTRDARIAYASAASLQSIPVMQEDESIALLDEWTYGALRETLWETKAQIVRRLGYLPLALKLAGTLLRTQSAATFLDTFSLLQQETKSVIPGNAEVCQTFELSLQALGDQDRSLCVALAIFREGEPLSRQAIERLWSALAGLGREQTAALLSDLQDRALLERSAGEQGQTVWLHDLLRDLLKIELGETARSLHQLLLCAYRDEREGWHLVPDDGYIYDHLVYHLTAADWQDDLRGLFKNHHWLHARVLQRHYIYDGYLEDLQVVWTCATELAQQEILQHQDGPHLAECMRYALIRVTITSAVGNFLPELVACAFERGVWSLQRVLSVATKMPDPRKRVRLALALLKTQRLDLQHYTQIQWLGGRAALTLPEQECVDALRFLVPLWTPDELAALLRTIFALERQLALHIGVALAPYLPPASLQDILNEVLTFTQAACVPLLVELAPSLDGPLVAQASRAALTFSEAASARVLQALLPRMNAEQRASVQEFIRRCDTWTCLPLLEQFNPRQVEELVAHHLVASSLLPAWEQAQQLVALAPYLRGEQLEYALQQARSLLLWDCVTVLAALAPYLPEHLMQQAFALVQTFPLNERYRGSEALVRHMSDAGRRQIFPVIASFPLEQRLDLFKICIPSLEESLVQQILEEALVLSFEMRARVLLAVAPSLADPLVSAAFELALSLAEPRRAEVLAALAPRLSAELVDRALRIQPVGSEEGPAASPSPWENSQQTGLQALPEIWRPREGGLVYTPDRRSGRTREAFGSLRALAVMRPWRRSPALTLKGFVWERTAVRADSRAYGQSTHALQIPEHLAQRIEQTRASRTTRDACKIMLTLPGLTRTDIDRLLLLTSLQECLAVMLALFPHMPKHFFPPVLQIALAFPTSACASMLSALAPYLSQADLDTAMEAILCFPDKEYAHTLQAFIPVLNETWIDQLFLQASTFSASRQMITLRALAPRLPAAMLPQSLSLALALPDQQKMSALLALAPRAFQQSLPEGLYRALLATCNTLDVSQRAEILSMLIAYLPDSLVEDTFALTFTFPAEEQEEIVALLLPRTPAPLVEQTLQNVFTCREQKRAEYLALLVPRLSSAQIVDVFQQALTLSPPQCAKLLAALASRLSGELLERALDLALTDLQTGGTRLLAAIALHLEGRGAMRALVAVLSVLPAAACSDVLAVFAASLLEKLASPLHPEACQQALDRLLQYAGDAEDAQARLLLDCAPDATHWLWEHMLYAAFHLPERASESSRALIGFIPECERADVLIALAAHLSEQTLQRGLQMVHHCLPAERFRALSALAPSLSDEGRLLALQEALTLPKHLCTQAVSVLFPPEQHPDVLIRLAPTLGADEQQTRTALELALALPEREAARVLKALCPALPADQIEVALQTILAQHRPGSIQVLLALAPRFTHAQLQQAVNVALTFAAWEDARQLFLQAAARERVSVLQSLLPWLSADSLRQALALLLDLPASERALLMRSLMVQLSGHMLLIVIETVLRLPHEERTDLLSGLLPSFTGPQLQHVLLLVQELPVEERMQVACSLFPYLPDREAALPLLLRLLVEALFALQHLSYEDFVARKIGEEVLCLTQGFPLAHKAIVHVLQEIPRHWTWI
jgi:hypothetical protein